MENIHIFKHIFPFLLKNITKHRSSKEITLSSDPNAEDKMLTYNQRQK